jgi:pimeloyl-ACP methyl ester carboxylesterase
MTWDQFWHKTLRLPYRLYTTSHGTYDKPVVVLLHGIAASGEGWGELIPLLSPYYRCITIDLLGFGRSPKPQWAEYDMKQHAHAIGHAIHTLHIPDDYILIGHSLGSFIATKYASEHPKHIKRLLLLSPPVYPPLDTIEGRLALRRTDLLMRIYRVLREHPRMTPANIRRLAKFGVLPQSIITHPDTWVPFKRSLEHCIEQQTILKDVADIQIPIDVFYGTLDAVVIGANVRALSRIRDVDVHSFRGNHQLYRPYAKVVAKLLVPR